ncbi:MAG: hypothetical protein ACLP5H_28970 [Desulfomonilaceae bacterium]
MNTIQTSQEKRTIKVKDFLDDFHTVMSDGELLKRYHLTPAGLEKFYSMLLDRGILSSQELQHHYRRENLHQPEAPKDEEEKAGFICPACLAAQDTMFDICPRCGVSFQELMSKERAPQGPDSEAPRAASSAQEERVPLGKKILDVFSGVRERSPFGDTASRQESKSTGVPPQDRDDGYFAVADNSSEARSGFDAPLNDIVHGSPLEYVNEADADSPAVDALCDTCQERMQSSLRDVYDRGRSYLAMKMSATSFVLGILGCLMVSFFDGYSLLRLMVVCATAISFLAGASLLTVGAFMFLAREKVFFCPLCKRVYPRG